MNWKAPIAMSLVSLFLAAGLTAGPPAGEPSGEGSQVAMIMAQILSDSRAGNRQPKSYVVREADLNAFLLDQLSVQAPAGLEKLSTRLLADNAFITWLTVDMDQIDMGEGTLTSLLMRGLFSGKQTLEIEGELDARAGQGRYTARRALLNGIAIPLALLNSLLKAVGDRVQPPFDPTEPFPLPYGIESIQVTSGQALLKTGIDAQP